MKYRHRFAIYMTKGNWKLKALIYGILAGVLGCLFLYHCIKDLRKHEPELYALHFGTIPPVLVP